MTDPSRPVTGYPAPPYGQPYPAQPNGNYPVYQQRQVYNARASFLRRFVLAMVALFVIVGSIMLLIWLILRPKVPDFRVDSFTVSGLNASTVRQSLTGTWTVGFVVFNTNKKMTVEYDQIDASVFYRNGFISETRAPPFTQAKRVTNSINATFSAADSFVEGGVVSGINADRARGVVSFNVKLLARVGFRKGGWRLRRRVLRVLCRDLPIAISNTGSGKMTGGARDCGVYV